MSESSTADNTRSATDWQRWLILGAGIAVVTAFFRPAIAIALGVAIIVVDVVDMRRAGRTPRWWTSFALAAAAIVIALGLLVAFSAVTFVGGSG